MLPIQWSVSAREDLATILDHIEERNPSAAIGLQKRIDHAVAQLPANPSLYRRGRRPGTREIVVHQHYIVVYRIRPTAIWIVAVLHARRHFPVLP